MTIANEENMNPNKIARMEPSAKALDDEDVDGEELEGEIDGEAEPDETLEEEYRVWKKNTPFLYDTVLTHCLTWPSLTCDWLPDKTEPPGQEYSVQKLILGTQTLDGNDNYLMIASIKLPKDELEVDVGKFEESSESNNQQGNPDQYRISITTRICHPGEVNRALHNPKNSFMIATKTNAGDVLVFDYSKHPSKPSVEGSVIPQVTLKGHSMEGYALSWNTLRDGWLASGGDDALICLWDVAVGTDSTVTLNGHARSVEAVSWHFTDPFRLASVGDDRRLLIWDTRSKSDPILRNSKAHDDDVNCVLFSPFSEYLVATAGADKCVALWDVRKIEKRLCTLEEGHTAEITNISWSPFSEHIIGTSGVDRRVVLWDLSKIGDEISEEDAADGPPELLFIHGGHTGRVNDFSFNTKDDWVVASVADDNVLQIWQVGENVYCYDSDDDQPDEIEIQ